jgi:GR25 family glycosyltransferase involved in LPS biosynthesis
VTFQKKKEKMSKDQNDVHDDDNDDYGYINDSDNDNDNDNNNNKNDDLYFLNSIIKNVKKKSKQEKNEKSPINQYFDQVFCLNLNKRTERMHIMNKRLQFVDLSYERFAGIDGSAVLPFIHQKLNNPNFSNSAYVGCCLSHLSIYQLALDRGYSKILILEDDNRVHRDAQKNFKKSILELEDDVDLIHFAYIPLTDDLTMWSYGLLDSNQLISDHFYKSKNLWSLMAYGISSKLMNHLLQIYQTSFPMELDRYFVNFILKDPNFKCRAIRPQLFCAEDNFSDNTKTFTPHLLTKSVDLRNSQFHDFI